MLTEATPSPQPLSNPYDQDNINEILAFNQMKETDQHIITTEPYQDNIEVTVGNTPRFSTIPRQATDLTNQSEIMSAHEALLEEEFQNEQNSGSQHNFDVVTEEEKTNQLDQIIDRMEIDDLGNNTQQESQFTFEVDNTRPEVTEADETEVKMNPHEALTEGIKYRTQDIERAACNNSRGPVSVMYHSAPQKVAVSEPKPLTL